MSDEELEHAVAAAFEKAFANLKQENDELRERLRRLEARMAQLEAARDAHDRRMSIRRNRH